VIALFLYVFFSFSSDNTSITIEDIPYVEIDVVTKNEISMAHHEINNLTGWGGIDRFHSNDSFDSFKNELDSILVRIDNAKKTCKNEIVLRDLIRAEIERYINERVD
jgi:hypothetical protein